MIRNMWAIGWIFTIGYLRLPFWQGVLAIIIWPYYLGVKFAEKYAGGHHS
ncbi:MAG: hypothetical protein AAB920_00115 [Patescibacteria group bacterium]